MRTSRSNTSVYLSALGGKADIGRALRNVPLRPKADITSCTRNVCFREQSRHHRLRKSAFAVAIGGKADMTFCGAHVGF
jgi:hypothetical protein